jgi:toxin ParE1/3/4
MSWRVVVRPDAQADVAEASKWYEARGEGLGVEFREAVIQVFDALADNPFLNCR